jgi:ribosome biogenesis GTPase
MANDRKKKGRPRPRKIRVDFRPNRAKRAREKDWTRRAQELGPDEVETPISERVSAKGELSRKRTVVEGPEGADAADDELRRGTVVTVFGPVAHVDDGKRVWPCSIRRVLRTRSIRERSAVVVGDRVRFSVPLDREGVEEEGVIESVEPRRGELKRVAGRREHTVVVNVDQAVIVSAASVPVPKPHLVDRYIVSALHGDIEPVICLNKIDEGTEPAMSSFLSIYLDLGYRTIATSAVTGEGVDLLCDVLKDKSSVLAGQSGVGKTTLLNVIQPGFDLPVGDVVEDTRKGRHTTTRGQLLKLDMGGYVVDTPGVKAFDISCVPPAELEQHFIEFVDRIPDCKFPDCTHIHEEQCAIREAVERGEIRPERYDSYVRLFTDEQLR